MSAFSTNEASRNATNQYASQVTDLDSAPFKIVYGNGQSYNTKSSSDPYGGTPINLNVNTGSDSAKGLESIGYSLSSGFEGLYDLIMKNTDKNNAWSAEQAAKQNAFQERQNQIAMDFNAAEAAKNRDWQEMMSNTAHQREVADLKAAGLNPVLSASGGNGSAVTSGATASGVTSSGAKGDTDTSANNALVSLYSSLIQAQNQMAMANLSARTNLQIAEMQKEANMYGYQLSANASMYGANQAAQASMYASDQNLLNNREQRQWNYDNPQTVQRAAIQSAREKTNQLTNNLWSNIKTTAKEALKGALNPFGFLT